MEKYTYLISAFPNDRVNLDSLTLEINGSTIAEPLQYMNLGSASVDIFFLDILSVGDVNKLDTIVANHQGNAPIETQVITSTIEIEQGLFIYDTSISGTDFTIAAIDASGKIVKVPDHTSLSSLNLLMGIKHICELVDSNGEQEINEVIPNPISWDQRDLYDPNIFDHVLGESKVTIKKNGLYEISYNVNGYTDGNSRATSGVQVRLNNSVLSGQFQKTLSSCYLRNKSNNDTTNAIPPCTLSLAVNDELELVGFRLGDSGSILTKKNASFLRIKYLGG